MSIHPHQIEKLAKQLVHNSLKVKKGETVLIEFDGTNVDAQALACAKEVINAGGVPFVQPMNTPLRRALIQSATSAQLKKLADYYLKQMQGMSCYLAIRGADNMYELNGLDPKKMAEFAKIVTFPVTNHRINKTRWVVTRYPTPSMAQLAEQSTTDFAAHYFKVCCLDYSNMTRAVVPLKKRMLTADRVHIKGPQTDLTFSIKGIGAKECTGEFNIPDGECFTAPVKTSINGTVLFNCKTLEREEGVGFEFIHLEFNKGKVVKVKTESAAKDKILNRILDRDAGSRYVGEFAIAFNPYIRLPINDILFDEKIDGSFHMALGKAYEVANNGNVSRLHWDLVQIQRPEFGGGEIWFDGELIRKNGRFMPKDLLPLNPEKLK